MAPKVMKKPSAKNSDEYFVLYVHFKFPNQEEERMKIHMKEEDGIKPEDRKLEELYERVVDCSDKVTLDEVEQAVALECTSFYLPDGSKLKAGRSIKSNGLKSGDKLGIMTSEYQIHGSMEVFIPDEEAPAPAPAKKQKDGQHGMMLNPELTAAQSFLARRETQPDPDGLCTHIPRLHMLMEDVFKQWAKIVKAHK